MYAFVKRKEDLPGTQAYWKAGGGSQQGWAPHLALDDTGKAQANEQRYSKLKEKYSELVQSHADLLRKVGPSSAPLLHAEPAQQGREQLRPRGFSKSSAPTSF